LGNDSEVVKMNDTDIDYEEIEPEDSGEICPECKSNKMIKYTQQNSPDDYDTIWECMACGTTQST
jgi:DNA-directed RNA polymerase subunit M/transcription elongation factor TFIIS